MANANSDDTVDSFLRKKLQFMSIGYSELIWNVFCNNKVSMEKRNNYSFL